MRYVYTTEELIDYINKEKNVVIYGAGDWGKSLADYVISIAMRDRISAMIVSKADEACCQYRGIPIYESQKYLEREQCSVVIAVSPRFQWEIVEVVEQYGKIYCCLSQDICWAMEMALDTRKKVPYKGIDFLVPGFTKCGSTSLHNALMTIEDIYLPKQKESLLFRWYNEVQDPEKVLIENYFNNIRKGQLVGMVEPTFAINAKEVYDFWGHDIKLIFLVRNPVESTFSRFKMTLRGERRAENLYQKFGKFSFEMFDEYVDGKDGKSHGVMISKYIDWINQFREYYPEDQIRIVFFEELIQNTSVVINDILKFIGSKHTYECEKLPLANEGNYVMADLESYRTAREHKKLSLEYKSCCGDDNLIKDQCYNKLVQAQREFDKAEKIYNVRMTEEQRTKLKAYYNDSVRRLEDYCHKALSDIWF